LGSQINFVCLFTNFNLSDQQTQQTTLHLPIKSIMENTIELDLTEIRVTNNTKFAIRNELNAELDTLKYILNDENDLNEFDVTVSITPQMDDGNTHAFTFRSIFLGLFLLISGTIWAIFLSCCNILFSFRTNSFIVPTGLAQLMSYPMGIFMARIIPKGFFNTGEFTIKVRFLF
jgi:hypothetical protein